MSIDEILDDMDEMLDKAGSVPFASHKSIIDGERMRELISDIRLNLPQEIKHAKMEDRAKTIVSQESIVREAKNRAIEIATQAKAECDAMRQAANADVARSRQDSEAIKQATNSYMSNLFADAENFYANALKDVQERKAKLDKLQKRKPERKQESQEQPKAES